MSSEVHDQQNPDNWNDAVNFAKGKIKDELQVCKNRGEKTPEKDLKFRVTYHDCKGKQTTATIYTKAYAMETAMAKLDNKMREYEEKGYQKPACVTVQVMKKNFLDRAIDKFDSISKFVKNPIASFSSQKNIEIKESSPSDKKADEKLYSLRNDLDPNSYTGFPKCFSKLLGWEKSRTKKPSNAKSCIAYIQQGNNLPFTYFGHHNPFRLHYCPSSAT